MKKIAVTGLNGVIGKIFIKELAKDFEIIDLYNKHKAMSPMVKKHVRLNLENNKNILKILETIKPDVVLHMAAITHIDMCEQDKKNGINGKVWKVNVDATGEIAKYCFKNNIFLVFLSTECVFNGKSKIYQENSRKNPINWYGFTKAKAEEIILESKAQAAIIRSVVAYHKNDENKTIYGKILNSLVNNGKVEAVYDKKFTPTHTNDIVRAINTVIRNKLVGIYHVAPNKILSPYDFAVLIAEKNNFSKENVKKIKLISFYDNKRSKIRLDNSCLSGKKSEKILRFVPLNPDKAL